MVNSIGADGMGRAAIEAALKRMHEKVAHIKGDQAQAAPDQPSFSEVVKAGVQSLDDSVRRAEQVELRAIKGDLDFHEVTAQLKESQLSFDFAMQVRNKFIEAYREVMRMNV